MSVRAAASVDSQTRDRGSEVRLSGVPEFLDQRMALEHLLHVATLHAFAAAMDQANLAQAGGVCLPDVLLDYRRHVAGRECVEVQGPVDRNAVDHRSQDAL